MNGSFRSDTGGVSTVIGVVLIVGITVVLMGVIGAFVLNAGPGTQQPTAEFSMTEIEESGDIHLDVRYAGGPDLVLKENIEVTVDGEPADLDGQDWNDEEGALELGDSTTVWDPGGDSLSENEVVRVVWTSDDGTTTDILAAYEVRG